MIVRKIDSPPETDNGTEPWAPVIGVGIRTMEGGPQVTEAFVSAGILVGEVAVSRLDAGDAFFGEAVGCVDEIGVPDDIDGLVLEGGYAVTSKSGYSVVDTGDR
jgi:hypothetical protein